MKKLSLFAIVMTFIFVAGSAMAATASFNVTNNYGVRVTEHGICEQVGSTSLTPSTDADVWPAGTVITVELLGQATVCTNTNYIISGTLGGVGTTASQWDVKLVQGQDFFTITLLAGSDGTGNSATNPGEALSFGITGSEICFNLANTSYNSQDANNQLVKVSYKDNMNDTYSGDIYVATVKPAPHVASICAKKDVGGGSGSILDLSGWGIGETISKAGLPQIGLCYTPAASQDQNPATCGEGTSTTPICVTIDDPANVFNGKTYTFAFTTDRAGVGIYGVKLYNSKGNQITSIGFGNTGGGTFWTKTDPVKTGTDPDKSIVPEDPTLKPGDAGYYYWYQVKRLEVNTATIPDGKIYAVVTLAYDACTATTGDFTMGLAFNRIPCGDSFSQSMTVATLVHCTSFYNLLLPYLPNVNQNWWAGMAVTNTGSTDETVTITATEADGDVYTGSVTIKAGHILAGLFGSDGWVTDQGLVPLTTTSADQAFGDERFSVQISDPGVNPYMSYGPDLNAFAMMGDGTQAQGYLNTYTGYYGIFGP